MRDRFAGRIILACAALAVGAWGVEAASITDTLKKFGNPGTAAPPGQAPAPPPAIAPPPPPTTSTNESRVLATIGDWTLTHTPARWSQVVQKRIAVCSAYTHAVDPGGETERSYVWFSRWERLPNLARFSISPGPSIENPSSVVVGTVERTVSAGQGSAFLVEAVDADLAKVMAKEGKGQLRLTIKTGSQRKSVVQTFSLDGFAEIYRKLQTECEPVPQFSR